MKRSAEWKNPISKHRIVKVVTYHLKTGQVCKVERDNYGLNLLWKYMQPLKYYILKLQIKSVKLRETELKANSNKWSIEKK